MKTAWKIYAKKADFDEIGKNFNVDKVVARIIRNRDVCGDEDIKKYLRGNLNDMNSPLQLADCDKLVNILSEKIQQNKKIRIVGDYDIDGICSTVILYMTITMLGGSVDYRIPHRILDGYGINENIVKEAIDEGVDTIITCDNGIAAIEPMSIAKHNGITVLITDHHQPYNQEGREILPDADAIVNPHRAGCTYPFKEICGAVVALKAMEVLIAGSVFTDTYLLKQWKHRVYELAAIATIGDVMPLLDENRIIVKEGLKLIHDTEITGMRALISACGIDIKKLSSYHIGFQIGPCLNASGRLDTAMMAIELLLEENQSRAAQLAEQLKALNDERKLMTENFVAKALNIAQSIQADNRVLVIYLPECHESIAGIIAGRVREAVYKPTLVITDSEQCLKGSARSIEGYNMFEELLACRELLLKFGGHPMAAGFSLEKDNLEKLSQRLNHNCALTDEQMIPVRWIDVVMPMSYVTPKLVEQLEVLEPFGAGNPKPVFAQKSLLVVRADLIGTGKNVMKLLLEDENHNRFSAVKFRCDWRSLPNVGDYVNLTYYPSINEFNGRKNIEFIIDEII